MAKLYAVKIVWGQADHEVVGVYADSSEQAKEYMEKKCSGAYWCEVRNTPITKIYEAK